VRPETVSALSPGARAPDTDARVEAVVTEVLFSGAVQQIVGNLADGSTVVAHQPASQTVPQRGSTATFHWDGSHCWLVDG